jgi:hypothetical protein
MMFTQLSLEHEGFYSLQELAHFFGPNYWWIFSTYNTQILIHYWRHSKTGTERIYLNCVPTSPNPIVNLHQYNHKTPKKYAVKRENARKGEEKTI